MTKIKRVLTFFVLVTAFLAWMDWAPLHYQWWHSGEWPTWAGENFQQWGGVRATIGRWVCPPCAAAAEQWYFVYFEVEAGPEERAALLPVHYDNPFLPDGFRVWWKANETDWYPVSLVSWYLYWLPQTVIWWVMYASDLFSRRLPWWVKYICSLLRSLRR